jgi:TPR repeat protein
MPDIFISYKKEEQETASTLATRLTEAGYDVWWDDALLAGERYEDEIASVLDQSRAVVVLWSRQSVKSDWVKAEAESARQQKKAFPVIIDDMSPAQMPLLYRGMHAARFTNWTGETTHPGYIELIGSIEDRIGRGQGPHLSENEAEAKLAETASAAVSIARTYLAESTDRPTAPPKPAPTPKRRDLRLPIIIGAAVVVAIAIGSVFAYFQVTANQVFDAANMKCLAWSQSATLDSYSNLPYFDDAAARDCAAAAQGRPNDGNALGRLAIMRIVEGVAINDALSLANRGVDLKGEAAYYALAVMYERGVNLQRDLARAGDNYKIAHDMGYARASGALCLLAIDSGGVIAGMLSTASEALSWCEAAALKNDPLGLLGRAYALETGFGGQQVDASGAAAIYRNLIARGNDEARVRLGILHHRGVGVPQDIGQAVELYRQAAQNNDGGGLRSLAIAYELGEGVNYDPLEASRLYERAGFRRDIPALLLADYSLDQFSYMTARVARDIEFLVEPADLPTAQRLRGALFSRGFQRNMDADRAGEELTACSNTGNLLCHVALGNYYVFGISGTRQPDVAIPYYQAAADEGEMYGQYWYAYMLDWGYGIEQDQAAAIQYYKRAAAQGHVLSQQRLAQLGQTY